MTKILDGSGFQHWQDLVDGGLTGIVDHLEEQAQDAVTKATLAVLESRPAAMANAYGPWTEVKGVLEAHPEAGFPAGAEFFQAEGALGALRVMRFERGPAKLLVLSCTHYGPFSMKPDRLLTMDEIIFVLDLWPDNVPSAVPVMKERDAMIVEVIQAGPPVPPKSKIILLSDRK